MNKKPFLHFKPASQIVQLAKTLFVQVLIYLKNVEYGILERGFEICDETVSVGVERFLIRLSPVLAEHHALLRFDNFTSGHVTTMRS